MLAVCVEGLGEGLGKRFGEERVEECPGECLGECRREGLGGWFFFAYLGPCEFGRGVWEMVWERVWGEGLGEGLEEILGAAFQCLCGET